MKRTFTIVFILVLFTFSCTTRNATLNNFNKVYLIASLPIQSGIDQVDSNIIKMGIITKGNIVIYELPRRVAYAQDGELICDTTLFEYFIHFDKDKIGFLFNHSDTSGIDTIGQKMPVDSILGIRIHTQLTLDSVLSNANLLSSTPLGDIKFENTYRLNNDKYYDTAYFYFDKALKDIRISLSRKLDSVYDSKLFKVELLSKYDTIRNRIFIENNIRKSIFEIRKGFVDNEKVLLSLIQKFKEGSLKK